MNEAVAVFSGPGHLLAYYNHALANLLGERPLEVSYGKAFPELQDWGPQLDRAWREGGAVYVPGMPLEVRQDPTAASPMEQRAFDVSFTRLTDKAGSAWGVLVLARDITAARVATERAQRAALIARIATELSRSLDLEETGRSVTRVGADLLGGCSVVDLWEPNSSLKRLAGSHKEARLQPVLEELLSFPRVTGGGPNEESIAYRVARTGRPATGTFDVEELARSSAGRRHAAIIRRLRPGPYLVVPLLVGARRLGALSVIRSTGAPAYTPRERALLDELADRASLALAHARDFDEQRTAALAFQRNLLPTDLRPIPGLEIVARYSAAARGSEVGGDWYDVLELPRGGTGLVIGDVEGHDVAAAALMGQVRSVVRAFAQEGHSPAQVAERVDRFLHKSGATRLVTMLYLQLFPKTRLLTSVRVGHPPALMIAPGERARELPGPTGPPFGVHDGEGVAGSRPPWREGSARLPEGATLALFTDGLVEEPGSNLDEGLGRLARTLDELSELISGRPVRDGANPGRTKPRVSLEKVADLAITNTLPPGDRRDDLALLLVRLT